MSPRRTGAPGSRGEQDGAAPVVSGEPVEEELTPDERLVEEAALRVEVEVRRQFGCELDVMPCRPAVRRSKLGEDRGEACVRASFLDGAQLGVRGCWRCR